MPYDNVEALIAKHPEWKDKSAKWKEAFVGAFNSAFKEGKDEESCFKIAHAAADKASEVVERSISTLDIEQSIAEGFMTALDDGAVEGYACTWSYAGDGIRFLPGCFTKSLAERAGKIPLMIRHISQSGTIDEVVGAVTSGHQDDKGLYVKASFMGDNRSQVAREFAIAGQANFFSIGARAVKYEVKSGLKYCSEAAIIDVIVTPNPADKAAAVLVARAAEPTKVTPIEPTKVTREDLLIRCRARLQSFNF